MTISEKLIRAKEDYDLVYEGGYEIGHETGYEIGHETGYEIGHETGYEEGKKDENTKIDTYVQMSKKAIVVRGGKISLDAGIEALPKAIINIPADISLSFYEDEEIAYRKIVPSGVEEYALLKSVGGMTYKCNNLIPFPYTLNTKEIDGITFTVADNGAVTLNGTTTLADGEVDDFTLALNLYLPAGTYCFSGIEGGDLYTLRMFCWIVKADGTNVYKGNGKITLEQGDRIKQLSIRFGYQLGTVNNLVVKPMLNEGTTALPYEPYFEGLGDTKVTEIVSHGKNLFDADNIIQGSFSSEGGFMSSGHLLRTSEPISIIGGETYVVSCNPSYDLRYLYFYGSENENISNMWMGRPTNHFYKFTAPTDARFVNIGFEIDGATSGTVIDLSAAKTNSEMQLERGSVNTEYTPYRELITPIPEAVQALEGYGIGAENFSNTIDFSAGKYIQRVKKITLDGTESWKKIWGNGYPVYMLTVTDAEHTTSYTATFKGICSHYTNSTHAKVYVGEVEEGISDIVTDIPTIAIRDNRFSTAAEFKSYLAEQYAAGTPVTIVYTLGEPIETELAQNFDNFLSVEGDGSLEFVNEHGNAVPSTVKYTIKVGS